MQRYFTCCIILWKNNAFSRRRLRTPACIDFGGLLAQFGRVWASKLEPCWLKLGVIWASNCDFWYLLGDLGALNWFWTSTRVDFRALATEDAVLEASRLDFGGPRPWFSIEVAMFLSSFWVQLTPLDSTRLHWTPHYQPLKVHAWIQSGCGGLRVAVSIILDIGNSES